MSKLSESMRRALAVLAQTELQERWALGGPVDVRRVDDGALVSINTSTSRALFRRGFCVRTSPGYLPLFWRITDAGRAALERPPCP